MIAGHRHFELPAPAVVGVDDDAVSQAGAEDFGQLLAQHDAAFRQRHRVHVHIKQPLHLRARREARKRQPLRPRAVAHRHRNQPAHLRIEHARQALHLLGHLHGFHIVESHGDVLAHGAEIGDVDHEFDGVEREQRRDQQRHGTGDAEGRQEGAHRIADQMPHDHRHRLRQALQQNGGGGPGLPVAHRRRGSHGDGGRQADGLAHRPQRADQRRRKADGAGRDIDLEGVQEHQEREMIEFAVHLRQAAAEPRARREAREDAAGGDHPGEFHVMQRHGHAPVAERLQQADLLAFQRDDARQRHVQQERGHGQENRRDDIGQGFKLLKFGVEEGVRLLVLARVGAGPAEGLQDRIGGGHDIGFHGVPAQLEADIVEGAIEIESAGRRRYGIHRMPKRRSSGTRSPGAMRVDELRRQHDAGDGQLALAAVEDGLQLRAKLEVVGFGEALVDEDLVVAVRSGQAPGTHEQRVQHRLAQFRQRHHPARRRRRPALRCRAALER